MDSVELHGVVDGLDGLVDPDAVLERIATGASWSEGPLWVPAIGHHPAHLRWSDIPGDRILRWDPVTGETSVHRTDVEFTNGRDLDHDGSVVQCSHGRRRVERERADGSIEIVADSWNGHRLNSPNDLVVARDGAVWFTDPPYGIIVEREGHPGEREYGDHWVFRVDSSGDVRPVVLDVEEPNGLAFSPGEAILYVADSSSVRKPPGVGNRHIRAYDVVHDGVGGVRCKNSRVFATVEHGFSDGIKVDRRGNVWSSSETGVVVFTPSGRQLGEIRVPELVGNLCFGGDDGSELFIAGSTSIYRIRTGTGDARR